MNAIAPRICGLMVLGLIACAVGLLVAPVNVQGGPIGVPPPPQTMGPVVSIPPTRVLDTRFCCGGPTGFTPDGSGIAGGPLQANTVRRFLITGKSFPQGTGGFAFPAETYGILANVTIVSTSGVGGGFVTVFPGDVGDTDRPNSSTVNPSSPIAFNFTSVGLGPAGSGSYAGTIAIYTTNTLDVIIDVVGYYTAPTVTSTGWGLTGNAGTSGGTNFLGTTDAQPLILKTYGNEALRVSPSGFVGINSTNPVQARLEVQDGGSIRAVYGASTGSTGVVGKSTNGRGVEGYSDNDTGVFGFGLVTGVRGNTGSGIAVHGTSYLTGVLGVSTAGIGVGGTSQSSTGVQGSSGGGTGVFGTSTSGFGVNGGSVTGAGVYGVSGSSSGVVAQSLTGNLMSGLNGSFVQKFHVDQNGTYVTGSDFAEALPARGGKAGHEPGDVLVLSDEEAGTLELASRPSDPRVAGVHSTRPGVLGADKGGETRVDADDVPLAMLGVVPTKVSAENGAIRPGDPLTTSATPGHAMKAPRPAEPGTLLGKALDPLPAGTGVIRVLVTLR